MEQQNKVIRWVVIGGSLAVVLLVVMVYLLQMAPSQRIVGDLPPGCCPQLVPADTISSSTLLAAAPSKASTTRLETDAGNFPVWKTITLGTYKRAGDLRAALERHGDDPIIPQARDLIENPTFPVRTTTTKVDLVVVDLADFGPGFTGGGDVLIKDIYKRALELGLELCPPEVGPQLLIQYNGEDRTEYPLEVAMEGIRDSRGILRGFEVQSNASGLELSAYSDSPSRTWHGSQEWVFVRPR